MSTLDRRQILKALIAAGLVPRRQARIPCGFSDGRPPLPIAIMFYGRPFDEPPS